MPVVNICYILKGYTKVGMRRGEIYAYTRSDMKMKLFLAIRNKDVFYVKKERLERDEYKNLKKRLHRKEIITSIDYSIGNEGLVFGLTKLEKDFVDAFVYHLYQQKMPRLAYLDLDSISCGKELNVLGYKFFQHIYNLIPSDTLDPSEYGMFQDKKVAMLINATNNIFFYSDEEDDEEDDENDII